MEMENRTRKAAWNGGKEKDGRSGGGKEIIAVRRRRETTMKTRRTVQ